MKKRQDGNHDATTLRRRAEERLVTDGTTEETPERDYRHLVHELEVHRIELEMQNEELRRSHAEAEELRQKYHDLFEFAPVGYVTLDDQGMIRDVNLTGSIMLGTERSRLVRRHLSHFIAQDFRLEFMEFRHRAMTGTKRERLDVKLNDTGAVRWVCLEATANATDEKQICGITISDITERKETRDALRESEERLRLLGNNIPDSALYQFLRTPDGNGRFVQFSTGVEKMNGVSVEEVMNDASILLRQVPAEYHPRLWEAEAQSARDLSDFDLEIPIIRPDGSQRWLRLHSRPRQLPDGSILWDGVQTDVTELKQMNLALVESCRRLDLVAATASRLLSSETSREIITAICTQVMEILGCQLFFNFLINERHDSLHLHAFAGISDDEAAGIAWLDYGTSVSGYAARNACGIVAEALMATAGPLGTPVASYGIRAYACHPLISRDRVLGTLSFGSRTKESFNPDELSLMQVIANQVAATMERAQLTDSLYSQNEELEVRVATRGEELLRSQQRLTNEISERTRTERELREKEQMLLQQNRLAAMGEMIRNIAHQWRQPLTILSLHLQRLAMAYDSGNMDPEFFRKSVDNALYQIDHMSQTINDFRNFFKPDKEMTRFSVSRAVMMAITLIRDSFTNSQIEIVTDLTDDQESEGYFNEFCQALMNILQNAYDALVERRVANGQVDIATFRKDGRAVITISDNAGGIPDEQLSKIFEPYFSTKGVQGTGIGLYMSKSIIENNMKGRLTVENTTHGATFTIEI